MASIVLPSICTPVPKKSDDQPSNCLTYHYKSSKLQTPLLLFRRNQCFSYKSRIRHHQVRRSLNISAAVGLNNNVAASSDLSRPIAYSPVHTTRNNVSDKEDDDVSGNLDLWVQDSIVEIVSNLDEAPFLVHIYSEKGDGQGATNKVRMVKEEAVAENWPMIVKRWDGGITSIPNGVMLVEEVGSSEAVDLETGTIALLGSSNKPSSSNKVWGILIQGRGVNSPVCYMLKTSRVRTASGACTHFCLARVESFYEQLDLQFSKLWTL